MAYTKKIKPNLNDMGKRITRRMAALHLTKYDLALRIGVSDKSISKWQKAQSSPQPRFLKKLASALDTDQEWLLHGDTAVDTPTDTAVDTPTDTAAYNTADAAGDALDNTDAPKLPRSKDVLEISFATKTDTDLEDEQPSVYTANEKVISEKKTKKKSPKKSKLIDEGDKSAAKLRKKAKKANKNKIYEMTHPLNVLPKSGRPLNMLAQLSNQNKKVLFVSYEDQGLITESEAFEKMISERVLVPTSNQDDSIQNMALANQRVKEAKKQADKLLKSAKKAAKKSKKAAKKSKKATIKLKVEEERLGAVKMSRARIIILGE